MSPAGRPAAGRAAQGSTWAWRASLLAMAGCLMMAPRGLRAQASPAPGNTTVTTGDFMALQQRYIELLGQAQPAVVKIDILCSDGITYLSTGFFISREGYVMTANAHLLQDAVRVVVEQNGVPYIADVMGVDLVTNIALLRTPKPPANFGVLNLTDSPDAPPVGSMLLAVTCKRGDEPGPSPGILQGYNIKYGEQNLHALYLRTNIPDDGAESGSPVFDLEGRLAGMMVVTLPETRSSLVLPARALMRVREDLLNHGRVLYGRFGFSGKQLVTAETGSEVLIDDVEFGGPAATAGLRVGDLLVSIGGTPIHSDQDMVQLTFFAQPGQYLNVRVYRDGRQIELPLQVGEMKLEEPAEPTGATPGTISGNSTATPATGQGAGNITGSNDATPPPVVPPVVLPPARTPIIGGNVSVPPNASPLQEPGN
ncbi:MAG: S1C family serine protease [Opitutales bacterium]